MPVGQIKVFFFILFFLCHYSITIIIRIIQIVYFFFVFFFRIFYTFIFITDPERYQRAFINSFFSARNSSCSKIFRSNVINTLFLFPATLISVTSFYYNIIISYICYTFATYILTKHDFSCFVNSLYLYTLYFLLFCSLYQL